MDGSLTFTAALADFLNWSLRPGTPMAYIVFMAFGGVAGAGLVALDACLVAQGGRSWLGLTQGWRRTPKAIVVWMIGGALASGFGLVARIFQPTPLSALLAAATWRGFLKLLLSMAHHQQEQRLDPGGDN
jgi:hypothetical protein